ncbi:MAG: hypothetical protein V4751_13245 [Pseudomonadota bacterium]
MFTKILLALCLTFASAVTIAQDLQLELLGDGNLIIGVVSGANAAPAVNVSVQIAQSLQPQISVATLQTDVAGIFTFTGEYEATYRVTVGNTIAEITLGEAPPAPFTWPPIYITLGALMLLSLIPARMLRRKEITPV